MLVWVTERLLQFLPSASAINFSNQAVVSAWFTSHITKNTVLEMFVDARKVKNTLISKCKN